MVDAMIVVAEPGRRSLATAQQIAKLARDIGVEALYLVGNKMRSEADVAFLQEHSPALPVLGTLPASPAVIEADVRGIAVYDAVPELAASGRRIVAELERRFGGGEGAKAKE
jgi:CO dehydrogenase maturation factor